MHGLLQDIIFSSSSGLASGDAVDSGSSGFSAVEQRLAFFALVLCIYAQQQLRCGGVVLIWAVFQKCRRMQQSVQQLISHIHAAHVDANGNSL